VGKYAFGFVLALVLGGVWTFNTVNYVATWETIRNRAEQDCQAQRILVPVFSSRPTLSPEQVAANCARYRANAAAEMPAPSDFEIEYAHAAFMSFMVVLLIGVIAWPVLLFVVKTVVQAVGHALARRAIG
jgi:hypothetical protein